MTDGLIQSNALKRIKELEAERDQWKARAEAMERAMRGDCSYCANRYGKRYTCESCCLEGALRNWELDQTEFTPMAPEAEAAE